MKNMKLKVLLVLCALLLLSAFIAERKETKKMIQEYRKLLKINSSSTLSVNKN